MNRAFKHEHQKKTRNTIFAGIREAGATNNFALFGLLEHSRSMTASYIDDFCFLIFCFFSDVIHMFYNDFSPQNDTRVKAIACENSRLTSGGFRSPAGQ